MSLFSFQGKVYLADRDANGKPVNMQWVGNAPSLQLDLSTETSPKFDSFSGNRLLIGQLSRGKTANVNITLDEWTKENLAVAFYAKEFVSQASNIEDEPLPESLAIGDVVQLDKPFISGLVINQGATELELGVDYAIESVNAGLIRILKAPGGPCTATYGAEVASSMTMFTAPTPEKWVFLDGMNTANNNEPVLMDLFKVQFQPASGTGLITDEYGQLTLTGGALFDTLNVSDDLGGFGRIRSKGD